MSANTSIEWADHTFNPWEGCQKIGPGCDHCYAETRNARYAGGTAINWGPGAPRRRTSASNWAKPLAWNANHAAFFAEHGHRQRVFCSSLADVFDNAVDPYWRVDLFKLIKATPNLDWLLLTKRVGNVLGMLPCDWGRRGADNVWLGATIVNQEEADRDIVKLVKTPFVRHFLSMEPLLGAVDLRFPTKLWGTDRCDHCCNGDRCDDPSHYERSRCPFCRGTGQQRVVDWVIIGGESGPGARPMHPDWARDLRDQCAAAGVPFLFKQWGEWAPGECAENTLSMRKVEVADLSLNGEWRYETIAGNSEFHRDDEPTMYRAGKKAAGRILDGLTHNSFPEAICNS